MAFESLTDKLQNVFKNLRGKGRLTEADVKTALKEVKMALLEMMNRSLPRTVDLISPLPSPEEKRGHSDSIRNVDRKSVV